MQPTETQLEQPPRAEDPRLAALLAALRVTARLQGGGDARISCWEGVVGFCDSLTGAPVVDWFTGRKSGGRLHDRGEDLAGHLTVAHVGQQ